MRKTGNTTRRSDGRGRGSASRKRVPPFLVLSVFHWPDGNQQANVIDWSHPHNIRTFGGKASGVLHRDAEVRTRHVRSWEDIPEELRDQVVSRAHPAVLVCLERAAREKEKQASNDELRMAS